MLDPDDICVSILPVIGPILVDRDLSAAQFQITAHLIQVYYD